MATISCKVDENLKKDAQKVLNGLGLNMSETIRENHEMLNNDGANLRKENLSFLSDDKVKEISKNLINENLDLYKKLAK